MSTCRSTKEEERSEGHLRVADSLALVVLAPERGGRRVAVVALGCVRIRREIVDRAEAVESVCTRYLLPRSHLGAALAVVVAHALRTRAFVLQDA